MYYAASGFDSSGEVTVDAGVEIEVRWEDVRQEIIDDRGNHIMTDAVVVVDRETPVGSIMWLGAESDLTGTSGLPESDIQTVVQYSEIPDVLNVAMRRVAYLARLSNEMPELT